MRLIGITALACALMAGPAYAGVAEGNAAWVARNYDKAVAEWRPAADAGSPEAQFNMGQAFKLGSGVGMNLAEAERWYRKAAAQGFTQAEDMLGLMLFREGRRADAMAFIEKSAARGEPRAMYVLGTAKFNGDLAQRDWPGAYALMKSAAAAGLASAATSLQQMDRYLTPADRAEADQLANRMVLTQAPPPPPSATPSSRYAPVNPGAAPRPAPVAAPPMQMAQAAPTYPVYPVNPDMTPPPPPALSDSGPTIDMGGATVAVPGNEVNVAPDGAARTPSNAGSNPWRAAPAPAPGPAPAPVPLAQPAAPPPAYVPPSPRPAAPAPTMTAPRPQPAPPTRVAPAPAPSPDPTPPPVATTVPPRAAPTPTPPPVAATPEAPTRRAPAAVPRLAGGKWKVQIGAFGTPGAAKDAWARLSRLPALQGASYAPQQAGTITRVQAAGIASKAEAQRVCRAVSASGSNCFPVAP